jgi:hypothetical protein
MSKFHKLFDKMLEESEITDAESGETLDALISINREDLEEYVLGLESLARRSLEIEGGDAKAES